MIGAPVPAGRPPGTGALRAVDDHASAELLDELLEVMVARGASDLHLTTDARPRVRIGGDLVELDGAEPIPHDVMDLFVRRLGRFDDADRPELGREIDTSWSHGEHRFRVNLYLAQGRASAALRAIPLRVPRLGDLDLPAALHRWPDHPRGLLLCCGPTGSGKTTTLAAVVRAISERRACHVVTMEDPIEYLHDSGLALVHQRSIGTDSESFATALRAALREDPDVILVGEMRDPETIRLALTAAETGHLVLSTVHASDAVGVINRLVDVFPGDEQPQVRTLLANTLLGASCQTLVKDALVPGRRHLVAEVLVANAAVRAAIREGRTTAIAQAVETGSAEGMQTFDRAFARAVADGKVARVDAEALTPDRPLFLRTLRELARSA
jgi:twitching motility protein PilT